MRPFVTLMVNKEVIRSDKTKIDTRVQEPEKKPIANTACSPSFFFFFFLCGDDSTTVMELKMMPMLLIVPRLQIAPRDLIMISAKSNDSHFSFATD